MPWSTAPALVATFDEHNASSDVDPRIRPGLDAQVFDLLTGRRAEVSYRLDKTQVPIPARTHVPGGISTTSAVWKFNLRTAVEPV